jgi:hypothetical protein
MSDEELVKRLRDMDGDSMSIKTLDEAADRIEALTAKLAKAVDTLSHYAIDANYAAPTNGKAYVLIDGVYCQGGPARDTLAEIEGKTPYGLEGGNE